MAYKQLIIVALSLLPGLLTGGLIAAKGTDQSRPQTGAQLQPQIKGTPSSLPYQSSFGVQDAGGGRSSAGTYQIEQRLTFFTKAEARQQSQFYQVVDLLSANRLGANNGLASGQGTIMKVSWTNNNLPPNTKGFNVFRSNTGNAGSYVKVNPDPLTATTYDDKNLRNGVYFYIIYLQDALDNPVQWTQPFIGVISVPLDSKTWMFY